MERGYRGCVQLYRFVLSAAYFIFLFIPFLAEAFEPDLEKELQQSLIQSRAIVLQARQKLNNSPAIDIEISKLKDISESVKISLALLQERFRLRQEAANQLGAKAGQRHRAMEEGYLNAIGEYLNLSEQLSAISGQLFSAQQSATPPLTSPLGKGGQREVIETLKTLLDKILPKNRRPIHGSLPYKNLNYPAREPDASPAIKPAYKGGSQTVSPDDTKDTPGAPLSLEIATLAQSLNWKPVAIYEYVKNNIETEWYWGCMKGAEETLRQRSGNDCDQATLLAAMLRASGFPTRYVRGTIEFFPDIQKAKNLTGIEDPLKMAEFFQKAGIPYKPVIQGGKITNLQIEHIWIESRIPYGNYRGTMIDDSDPTWLGLDTSIKPKGYTYNTPPELSADSAQLSAIKDEYLSAVQTGTPLEYFKESLSAISGQAADSYKLTRSLIPESMKILPDSMQFDQKKITHEYTEIPEDLKHNVKLSAFSNQSTVNSSPLFEITLPLYKLSNQKIVITYEPETVEDQQIINSFGGLDNTPAYLVRLRPVLKINGEMVVAGKDGLPMGEDYTLTIELISPHGTERISNSHIAGNLTAIGIVAQKAISSQLSAISEEDDAEAILFKEANRYIDRWNQAEDELASLMHLAISRPIPTVVTVGGVIDVTYLLDMPHGFEWKGVFIDASLRAVSPITHNASPITHNASPITADRHKTFMQLSGLQGSVLEHKIFEDDFQVESISTAKLIQVISDQQSAFSGQLLTVDKTNITAVLSASDLDDNIKEDIINAVNQNYIVRIPSADGLLLNAISYKDWTGVGYIKENPSTGEAGYMLSGMIAGGMTAIKEWLNNYLKAALGTPYNGKPSIGPATSIVRIAPTDRQSGIVGKQLGQQLMVLVQDKKGVPVQGAKVTFRVVAGGGNFGKNALGEFQDKIEVKTGNNGIAKTKYFLGLYTADNPLYTKLNEKDEFITQIGLNLVMATTGNIGIQQPFNAYGRPDIEGPGKNIIDVFGNQSETLVNSPVGNLVGKVVDRYGNPLSNVDILFRVSPAVSGKPDVPLPANYRNVKLYKQEECSLPFPLYGECSKYYDSVSVKTEYYGGKISAVLGNTVNTEYTVQVTALNLTGVAPTEFKLKSGGYRKTADAYAPHNLHLKRLEIYTPEGQLANAAKAGTPLKSPLTAELFVTYEEMVTEGPAACTIDNQQTSCWKVKSKDGLVKTSKITDGAVTFTPITGGGTVTAVNNLGSGKYQAAYTTGAEPLKNVIEAWGEATITVPEIRYNFSTDNFIVLSEVPVARQATLRSSQFVFFDKDTGKPQTGICLKNVVTEQTECYGSDYFIKTNYTAYGVDVSLTTEPKLMMRSDKGYTYVDTKLNYTILPPEYSASIVDIDLLMDGYWAGYLPGIKTQGSDSVTITPGSRFDVNATYAAEAVLNRGSAIEVRSEKVPLLNAALIPDYDHNGIIDGADRDRAFRGDTFYFWINDDDDEGETDGSDIPQANNYAMQPYLNYSDHVVNGTRDLIDFFPVYLDIRDLLKNYEPAKYAYKLRSEDESLNFVFTDLEALHAGYHLRGDDNNLKIPNDLGDANTARINTEGTFLNNHPDKPAFLEGIKLGKIGVVLIEGRKASSKPLELVVIDANQKAVVSMKLNLSLSGVEQMFRHRNLNPAANAALVPAAGSKAGELSRNDAPKCPDVECMGADPENIKNFVFLHGYNVNGQEARGWQSEMFKRMFWSGSKARFWGVTWDGWDTQEIPAIGSVPFTRNYHINVQHAFATAPALRDFLLNSIDGEITLAGHSLGNMVISAMLTDNADFWDVNGKIKNYFMIDAAVAMEAYDGASVQEIDKKSSPVASLQKRYMDHQEWAGAGYKDFLFASEWYTLFAKNDARRQLTWRDRFKVRPSGTKYYNFYSSGEDALGKLPYNQSSWEAVVDIVKNSGKFSWVTQERLKGRLPIGLLLGSNYGGWGFNHEWDELVTDPNNVELSITVQKPTSEANQILSSDLKAKPFFNKGTQDDLFTSGTIGLNSIDYTRRSRLLAEVFPAMTLPAGGNEVIVNSELKITNTDIQVKFQRAGIWPKIRDKDLSWRHSDAREVAYPFVFRLFEAMVDVIEKGVAK